MLGIVAALAVGLTVATSLGGMLSPSDASLKLIERNHRRGEAAELLTIVRGLDIRFATCQDFGAGQGAADLAAPGETEVCGYRVAAREARPIAAATLGASLLPPPVASAPTAATYRFPEHDFDWRGLQWQVSAIQTATQRVLHVTPAAVPAARLKSLAETLRAGLSPRSSRLQSPGVQLWAGNSGSPVPLTGGQLVYPNFAILLVNSES